MGFGETQRYCPDDRTPLRKVNDPRGVTIDECPTCGIVVLDRGELPMLVNTIASAPGFQTRSASHFGSHGGHHGHRRGHRDGIFDDFFGGSS